MLNCLVFAKESGHPYPEGAGYVSRFSSLKVGGEGKGSSHSEKRLEILLSGEGYLIDGIPLDSIDDKKALDLRNSFGESDLLDALEKRIVLEAWRSKNIELATNVLYAGTLIATSTSATFYNLLTDMGIFEEKPSKEQIQKCLIDKWLKRH